MTLAEHDLREIQVALHAQAYLIQRLTATVVAAETQLADTSDQHTQLAALAQMMDEIERQADLLEPDDLASLETDDIPRLYAQLYATRQAALSQDLVKLGCADWPSFVRQCRQYTFQHGVDPFAPYEVLLTEEDLRRLHDESPGAQYRWDACDYLFVGASGILAALTDVLLVKDPRSSPLTKWLKSYDTRTADDWFGQWARELEARCKVPYDTMKNVDGERIPPMSPKSHRWQTLGHDPVLGFVFGVLDIMRGTVTGFSYDHLCGRHEWIHGTVVGADDQIGLIAAILRQLGHLLSDVATPMGLPVPFMTLLQAFNVGDIGGKERTVGQVARLMYLKGYDLRHYLATGFVPGVIEIVLRAYIMLRHYAEHGEMPLLVASSPKYRSMLLTAHGIAAMGNAGKVTLMQGNPLAINIAEWQAFVRYLIPSIHYWVFDKHRLRLENLEQITDAGWDDLLVQGGLLLERVTATAEGYPSVTLGKGEGGFVPPEQC